MWQTAARPTHLQAELGLGVHQRILHLRGTHFRALAIVLPPIPSRGHSPCDVQAGLSFPAPGSGPLALGASIGSHGHSRDRRAPSSVPGSLGGSGWRPTVPPCLKGPTPGLKSAGRYVSCQWPTGPGTCMSDQ